MTKDTLTLGALLDLPLAAVTRTAAVVGQKGTGKTSTAVVLVEEAAAAGARFAVMDPTGAWSGLRSSADGEGPGLDCVVMGGHHGDVPLDPGAGEVVARLVVEEGYSVVCDLERMVRSQQITFVADFSAAALELCRSAVTVVYDEAPRFAPQAGAGVDDDGVRCRTAVTEVVMLGRRKGLGTVLISQRPSKLHKDVLEQSDVMIAHRLMGNNDRKAISGWLEEYGEEAGDWLSRLPKLRVGEAVVLAPEYDIAGVFQVRMKATFDSSASPDVGAVILDAPRGRASIDLGDLEAKMGHALEAAQENDPEALRRRIRRLEQQLTENGDGASRDELVREYDRGRHEGEAAVLGRLATPLIDLHGLARPLVAQAGHVLDAIVAIRDQVPDPDAPRPAAPEPVERVAPVEPGPRVNGSRGEVLRTDPRRAVEIWPGNAEMPHLKAGARRMIRVLDAYQDVRPDGLTRAELSTLAVVAKGGTLSDYLSSLRTHGLIAEQDGKVYLTETGRQVEPDVRAPYEPAEVVALHAPKLKAGARRMLDVLMRAPEQGFTRRELGGLANVAAGGTLSDYLSSLRSRGLIDERSKRIFPGSVLYLGASGLRR